MSQTDLLIVRASGQKTLYGNLSSKRLTGIEPPLWAAIMAAFIRQQGFKVEILDAEVLNLSHEETANRIRDMRPRLAQVVVSGTNPLASTWNMTEAGLLLRHLKQVAPEINSIIYGLHPSALPERTLREEAMDFVCRGEGFQTILQLLQQLRSGLSEYNKIPGLGYRENGHINMNPHSPLIENLDQLPMPAWDLLPMKNYRAHNWHCLGGRYARQPYAVIYTSLGCPFNCSFCCIQSFFGKRGIRYRSPQLVLEEIDYLVKNFEIKNIRIIDEMFVLNPKHIGQLCDLLIEKGYDLNIWVYARVDTVKPELLAKLRKAGVTWICYGFESANQKVLDAVSKGFTGDKLQQAVQMTKDEGLYILGNFMFGFPDDTLATMQATLDLAQEMNCEYVNFYSCMAYPGSKLYQEAVKNKVRLPDTWEGYSQFSSETLPLATKHITGPEVLRFRDKAFKEYFSNPRYQQMVTEKFGIEAADSIRAMLKTEIKRKHA